MSNIIFGIILACLTGIFPAGCQDKVQPGRKDIDRETVYGVRIENIKPSQVDEYYETSGTVKAGTISMISSRVMGTVTGIYVREGDRVSAGDLLIAIDDRDIKLRAESARHGYEEALRALEMAKEKRTLAEKTYNRHKKLYDEKAVTGQELDQIETGMKVADLAFKSAEAAVNRAEAGLKEAQVYLGFTRITSPVNGVVTGKKIDVGSMAVPGTPLLRVEDDSSYRMDVYADEKWMGRITKGMEPSVYIDSLNSRIKGKVSEVVPSVHPAARNFTVKIQLEGRGLSTGMYGRVLFPVGKMELLLVPEKSVVKKGQLTGLYFVDKDSVITFRLVRTGKKYGDKVEVLSGLEPADKVIVEGTDRAIDGGVVSSL